MLRRTLVMIAMLALGACGGEPEPPVKNPEPPLPPPRIAAPTASATAAPAAKPALPYPAARVADVPATMHGVTVHDPYRWLEDVKSPEVQTWMSAEDALARGELAKLPERDAIAKRLKELFYVDSLSAPVRRGPRFFYRRRHATLEKSIIHWREGKTGAEKTLLDPNAWSKDGSLALGGWSVSWDGKRVAYTQKKNNSDEATLFVMDVATGKLSETDTIEGARYASASWTPKGDGFFYTWLDMDPNIPEAERPGHAEVRYHALGTDPKKDLVVEVRTNDPAIFLSGDVSRDGHWLLLSRYHGWSSTDVFVADARKSAGTKPAWTPLAVGKKAHFSVEAHADKLYVMTDEGAPRWKLMRADPKKPDAPWETLVAERPDATMDGFGVIGGKLAVTYLKDASSRLELHDLDGKLVREIALGGIGSLSGPVGLPEDDEAYFAFESFTAPVEVRSMSVKTGGTKVYSKVEVPIDASPYVTEQVFFPSKDGTRVSMFIVHRKGLAKDGASRALLYGYGGFLASETPAFRASIYPWLERGGIYAVANLRGGGEYGEAWHQAGMLTKKQNVFDDFFAAAEYLVKERYTSPKKLVAEGASNGGLLVAAAVTQRPDLFGAALCGVPLADMIRYHLTEAGHTWTSEYGSADDAEQFAALLAYSPVHHVKPGTAYPATLILSADTDDRVDPMHARKMAALLQAASTGGPVLLRIEKNSGHGGADLLKAEVEKGADKFAFALAHTR